MSYGSQYPIWNQIEACIYKGGKSYGAKNTSNTNVFVGSSSKNSHFFVNHKTTHRTLDDGTKEFRFFVDNKLIKRAQVKDGEIKFLSVEEH